jgi:hypothetical protein
MTFTTAQIFTDMVGEFPTEIEDFGPALIEAAYSAYRGGLGNFVSANYVRVDGDGEDVPTMYASYKANRCGMNWFAFVTCEWDDEREPEQFRVAFNADVDVRDPESALAERW